MARDVEVDVTANDKTAAGLLSAERNFRRSGDRIKKESDKFGDGLSGDLLRSVEKVSPKLAQTLAGAIGEAGVISVPELAAGLALGAPLIGSVISGAIIGGAGLGGVVGGVLLASKDTRVQAAFNGMAVRFEGRLERASVPFIDTTIRGIDTIERHLDGINFERILGNSAAFVEPLANAVGSALEDLGDGLDSLVANAGPAIGAIANGISDIGDSVGNGLESLADNGDQAQAALTAVFDTVEAGVDVTFAVVNAMTELAEQVGKVGEKAHELTGWDASVRQMRTATVGAASAAAEFQRVTDEMAESAKGLADGINSVVDAIHGWYDENLALVGSETSAFEAIDNATAALKDNGRTLDVHTGKGRANRRALTDAAGAINAYYDKLVSVNGLTPDVVNTGNQFRDSFIRAARGAGLGQHAAENFADSVLHIPPSHDTKITANASAAQAAARAAQAAINAVHGKTVRIDVVTNAYRVVHDNADRLQFDAAASWRSASGDGTSRTGGPSPVSVHSDVAVNLDGRPFYDMTVAAVERSNSRQAWRAKVGRR